MAWRASNLWMNDNMKRPAEAGRFCQSGIAVAGLIVRQFGILVILAGSLTLLA
jgi:hypothetical protein